MALEISGKIVKLLSEQAGAGKNGPWKKQEFILETVEQYPKKVCISAWGDKVDVLQGYAIGDEVKVSFNIESREYNERWYTDVRVWKLEGAGGGSPVADNTAKKEKTKQSDPDVSTFHADAQEEDDLPF
jgi:hypothetical protein